MKPRWKWTWIAMGALLLIVVGVFFVQQAGAWRTPNHPIVLWEFTENDVAIKIEVRKYPLGQLELLGTFTPTRKNFHLYSKDLPRNGLNGLGRPTLLEVTSPDRIKSAGLLTAYQPTKDLYIETLELSFLVYPEGPVVLGLLFEVVAADHPASIELSVTYMACSDQTCLPPVIDRRFTVSIPNEVLRRP